jgi:transposase
MIQEVKDELYRRFKLFVLTHARVTKDVTRTCKEFEIPRSSYYNWKKKYDEGGEGGLVRKKPIPHSFPKQLSQETIDKILELRQTYHLGPQRIAWYLERYHGITTSCSTVYRTLVRNGMRRLPKSAPRRAIHTKRYSKSVPGHHIQVDVKFI